MRAKVYNDINNSNYSVNIGKVSLFFSSEFNRKRFIEGYNDFINEENKKIENKYHVKILAHYYLLFSYYKKIEKRGFRIENNITGSRINENLIFHIEL